MQSRHYHGLFDLQEMKRMEQSFLCFDNFYSLILAADFRQYINGNLLK